MEESPRRFPPWLIAAFACTMLALFAGGSWLYFSQRNHRRDEAEADLTAIGRLKIAQVVQWRAERVADAQIVSESPIVANDLAAAHKVRRTLDGEQGRAG